MRMRGETALTELLVHSPASYGSEDPIRERRRRQRVRVLTVVDIEVAENFDEALRLCRTIGVI